MLCSGITAMTPRCLCSAALCLWLAAVATAADEPAIPPGDKAPVLRVEAGRPTAYVSALAFSPDGETLYAAGIDKVVRVYALNKQTGEFALSSTAYRVPVGPGHQGVINALALSPDGAWLAVGG